MNFSRNFWIYAVLTSSVLAASCAHRDPAGDQQADGDTRSAALRAVDTPSHTERFPSVLASASASASTGSASTNSAAPNFALPGQWRHHTFPGKKPTQYSDQLSDSRPVLYAQAAASASMLRQAVRVEPAQLRNIDFSWKVEQLIAGANLAQREAHDSPVRIVLAFEGDRSTFSMKNAMLSELAQTLTGEPLPYATVMYVWCNDCTADAVFINPRTDRIREIAVNAGSAALGRWVSHRRDIRADFEKLFGEAPGALLNVGIMTDTDNTRQDAVAWYGPISLSTP